MAKPEILARLETGTPIIEEGLVRELLLSRDEMLRRFREARDTIRGKLAAFAETDLA